MPSSPANGLIRRSSLILISTALLLLANGCVRPGPVDWHRADACDEVSARVNFKDRIQTLNLISDAFTYKCYAQVVQLGSRAQSEYRYKKFSIVKETSNIFIPEGTLLDYVLESYERGFLTFLISASYFKIGQPDEARVELRRLDDEMKAGLYNYGEDPINVILQAVMWEKLGEPAESRVDWLNLQDGKNTPEDISSFAGNRIAKIDSGERMNSDWKIYGVDRFPEITWELKFLKADSGYFRVMAKEPFLEDCSSSTGLRVSAKSWVNKIAMRHSRGYHPLVNVRSWIRLPIGIVYGITTFSSGAGIIVGGCALDAAGKGSGGLCYLSIYGGAALIAESPKVLKHTLKPDFRHWENLPSSFLFTTADEPGLEKCAADLASQGQIYRIF